MTFWVAGAAIVGGVGGALISSNAAQNAANTQANAANQANQTQWNMYEQTRQDNMPALGARNDALSRLETLLGVGGSPTATGYGSLGGPITVGDVTQEPGYQFGMNQGMRQLQQQETARGMNASGSALKAASQFGNDYATTKYDDAFNRTISNRNAQLNPLQSLAGLGQTGASNIALAGMNAGNQIGANQIGAGNALAASDLAQGTTWSNGLNALTGYFMRNQTNNAMPQGWASGVQSQGWYDQPGYGPE